MEKRAEIFKGRNWINDIIYIYLLHNQSIARSFFLGARSDHYLLSKKWAKSDQIICFFHFQKLSQFLSFFLQKWSRSWSDPDHFRSSNTLAESNKGKVFQMYLSVWYWVTNYHWQSVCSLHTRLVDIVRRCSKWFTRKVFFAIGKTRYFADVTVIIYRKVI